MKKQYRDTFYQKELTEIFQSWELQLYDHLKEVDHILARISTEASIWSVPHETRHNFIKKQLVDMFEQIAEQREGKEYAKVSGD